MVYIHGSVVVVICNKSEPSSRISLNMSYRLQTFQLFFYHARFTDKFEYEFLIDICKQKLVIIYSYYEFLSDLFLEIDVLNCLLSHNFWCSLSLEIQLKSFLKSRLYALIFFKHVKNT